MKLDIQKLQVGYDSRILVNEWDATLKAGGLHFLIGSNGAGKSSLLRCMAGLQSPLGGMVYYDNVDIHGLGMRQRASHVAFLSGGRQKRSRIAVEEFLHIGRKAAESRQSWKERAEQLAHRTGVEDLFTSRLNELSDGEYQKVAISLVLLQQSPVLLLDEPLAHLDPPSQHEMVHLFSQLAEDHIVIVSSHQLEAVRKNAARVFGLTCDSQILELGSASLRDSTILERIFGSGMAKISRIDSFAYVCLTIYHIC